MGGGGARVISVNVTPGTRFSLAICRVGVGVEEQMSGVGITFLGLFQRNRLSLIMRAVSF